MTARPISRASSGARIGQLHGLDGRLIASKAEADAEAMARLPDGSWLVAFERDHRLWRYRTLTATPTPVEGPAEIGRQPANGGIEALAALRRRPRHRHQRGIQRAGRHGDGLDRHAVSRRPLPVALVQLRHHPRLPADRHRAAARRLVRRARAGVRLRARRALPRHALRRQPARGRRQGAGRGAGAPRLALCGRQSGGHRRDPRAARRDAGLADLGRQLQSASAQHPAAVRAGRSRRQGRSPAARDGASAFSWRPSWPWPRRRGASGPSSRG